MPDFDNNYLLELLRSHTRIPAVPGFEDADCLRDLTSALHGYILPMVKAEWQEHWLAAESATTVLSLVDGQAEYQLPRRMVAGSIRTAVLVSSDGRNRIPMDFMEVDRMERNGRSVGSPQWYSFRSNRMVLYPIPQNMGGYTLRIPALIRPARLVLPDACAEVLTVTPSGGGADVTISAPVSGISGVASLDVVRGQEPFETVVLEAGATWGGGTTATLITDSTNLQAGDWLCVPGTSPFPQCPVELQDLLALRVAVEQLAGGGDVDIATAKGASLEERRADGRVNVKPRTGDPRHQQNGMAKWRFGNGAFNKLTNRGGIGF